MASVGPDMRGQYARRAGKFAHFHHQRVGRRAMVVAARVLFVGEDLFPHESLYSYGHLQRFGADRHVVVVPFVAPDLSKALSRPKCTCANC